MTKGQKYDKKETVTNLIINQFLKKMEKVLFWGGIALALVALVAVILLVKWVFGLRRVVSPNEVHVVRQGSKTLVYGKVESGSGNTYYEWPVWLPVLGVDVTVLPLSVFSLNLNDYSAYDKDRLPFVVDIQAFFRISNYELAATRIQDFDELKKQLLGILQGASRSLLANEVLEDIMGKRNEYGDKFTNAVKSQLSSWGVETVKNIELMDIRDERGEVVIENIMKKKKSEIDKDSRITVANNNKEAETAEIEASQVIEMRQQEKEETVGKKKATVDASVKMAQESAEQQVQEQKKLTTEKEKAVKEVAATRDAEIAQKAKVIEAETAKKEKVLEAEAGLEAAKKQAEGVRVNGEASADAEKAIQMASVTAQIELAKEIGENQGYQSYLVQKQQIEANREVGIEQAKNLSGAEIKIIAGAGGVGQGLSDAAGALSPKGGFAMAGMLEALSSSDEGKKILEALGAFMSKKATPTPGE